MALRKVLGTETEFGITILNQAGFNPVLASIVGHQLLSRERVQDPMVIRRGDPGTRSPGRRRVPTRSASDPEVGLVNTVLTNGARLYVDHAHPEYSSPECADPWTAALYDKAGEVVLVDAVAAAQRLLATRRAHGRPQEQLRRQGELLRGARELPHLADDPVR